MLARERLERGVALLGVAALTGAVVEEALNAGPVERVAFGIMPGNDAPRGPALVAAIVGSAGRYMSMAKGPTAAIKPSTIAFLA